MSGKFDAQIVAELADAFSDLAESEKAPASASRLERRLITGFEDILVFVDAHGRAPVDAAGRDIFERMYACRLEALREHPLREALLDPEDRHGLFQAPPPTDVQAELSPAELAAAFADLDSDGFDELRFVRSTEERKAAEEIAASTPCADFETFEPLLQQVQEQLSTGLRGSSPFEGWGNIEQGDFFILGGQLAYVAEKSEEWMQDYGKPDARLRVIFANRTENNLLMRSLARALQRDERGRRVHRPDDGPLFSGEFDEGDQRSGTIYVLRSKSTRPYISENRELVHKIGVTSSKIERRIVDAVNQPTFLLAEVEVVATWDLANIERHRLERLLHEIFAPARLDLEIEDRFGKKVRPREWFVVPIGAIEEAVARIMDGSIRDYVYDPKVAGFRKA